MTVPATTIFTEMALEHLKMITADTAVPEIRLHCHFARAFLEIASKEGQAKVMTPEMPNGRVLC